MPENTYRKRASRTREQNAKMTDLEMSSLEAGKKVPQAIEIEEAVLGAMMLDKNIIDNIMVSLSDDCFYKRENKKIFGAINQLHNTNSPIDIYTVSEQLKTTGEYDEVGGAPYLTYLSGKIGAAAHVDYYTKILIDKHVQREMISIAYDTLKKSYDDSEPVDDLLDSTQQKLFDLGQNNMSKKEQKIEDVIRLKLKDLNDMQTAENGQTGLYSGYMALDRVTFGWHPSDLVIIAGRPGMGKTAFVLTMARNMAVNYNYPVAFFSLEQAPSQLIERLLIAESGLPSEKIKGSKKMRPSDWTQLEDRINPLVNAPIFIDDTPALSIQELRAKARRLVNGGVKIIIIDYLQLMTGSKEMKGNREQEVAEISRSLKAIAKELNVPILALAQLSRAAEASGGLKKPQLTHLRESGAIEQDADIVLFIHRPEYYQTPDIGMEGETDIIIAKHRNGATGEVQLKFIKSQMKFMDAPDMMEQEYQGGDPTVQFSSKMNNASTDYIVEEDYDYGGGDY